MSGIRSFNEQILYLNESLSRVDLNFHEINVLLDDLNAFHNNEINKIDGEVLERQVVICCTSIPGNNSLLVAKSCNLLLNLLKKHKIIFGKESLISILKWINDAALQSSDIAFLDILQVLNGIIKTHSPFFSENGDAMVPILYEKLELLTNVMQPNDVKMWRVFCLQSLAKTVFKEDRIRVISELLNIVLAQFTDDLIHAKLLRIVVETLDSLCPKGNTKWLLDKLNDIMNVVLVSTTLGLNCYETSTKMLVFPSTSLARDCTKYDTDVSANKKKHKTKVKRISWNEKSDEDLEIQAACSLEVYQVGGLTSDSDLSDGEGGKVVNIAKEQAKTRHATFNLVIRLANILKWKQLYGYYHPLLSILILCLRKESVIKVKIGILAAIAALLHHSKPVLALAQHSASTSFMAFSESLSELITSLHSCLGNCLSGATTTSLPPLLHTTATLISVSPYHRLRPSLLSNIFCSLQPYLMHKDPDVCEGGLKCLYEIVCIEPNISEQKEILKGFKEVEVSPTSYWILSVTTTLLENSSCKEKVRIVCWQILCSLCKQHFFVIQDNLQSIENIFFSNLNSASSEEQTHVVIALNKFLEQLIGKSELEIYNKQVWNKLMEGPLISLLQSPEQIACEACDCLANMGPIIFNSLKQEEQILIITLIFGCVNHEKPKVRVAAVHTLGIFLLFPQLTQEQFLYDARDLLEKSLFDSYVMVRIKAAWALGNLVDLIINNESTEFLNDFNLRKLLSTCLTVVKDDELVKSNILRAIGYILYILSKEDLENIQCRDLLEKAVQFFLKCTSSGTKMKMRWNACYAVGTMLRNEELYNYSEKWMGSLLKTLCNLIVSCNNFKVRASATTALCNIKRRTYFCNHYSFVFISLLDGLENAANMTDFKEYKHQDSLKQHLCTAICHLVALLEVEDIVEIERIMVLRLGNVMQHFIYFQKNTPPEKTGIMITAANHIQNLLLMPDALPHKGFLNDFKKLFYIVQ
ncbi:HEAT repeat-containing protein 6 isoform X2 [Halyomorpha halys]|uniref:HEAT repeat-containing protein 6 isoform X2 n=1 Tax=Halyomorpha halys TaxID=286706 RepID=UPI0006D4F358|nr:HEAT repeat-containing protein 6 isoform X2 [Halyomorpha halys]